MKELTILHLAKILMQKLWIIITLFTVGCAASFCVAEFALPAKYQSTVSMYVKNNTTIVQDNIINMGDLNASKSLVETYIVVLNNNAVLKEVGADLIKTQDIKLLRECFAVNAEGTYISPASIRKTLAMSAEQQTEVLKIVAETRNPEISAAVCNILSELAPDFLMRVVGAGGVETIGAAEVNYTPTSPNVRKITVMGGAAGIFAAIFLILLMDVLDNTIKNAEEAEKLFGKPVIGEIHSITAYKKKKASADNTCDVLGKDMPFYINEAYKTMRSNFIFSLAVTDKKAVVVTSANVGEGKSTTAANLAISLAQTEHKILLIDADMRKPVQYKNFNLTNRNGLSKIIGGKKKFEDCVNRGVRVNLDVLTSGPNPPNPSELLGAKQTAALFEKLSKEYDYIIIDTPPIGVVSDVLAMSGLIAGVMIVVNHAVTTFEDVAHAAKNIELANENLLGLVFNHIKEKRFGGYYSKYGYFRYGRYRRYGKYAAYSNFYGDDYDDTESQTVGSDDPGAP